MPSKGSGGFPSSLAVAITVVVTGGGCGAVKLGWILGTVTIDGGGHGSGCGTVGFLATVGVNGVG